MSKTARFSLVLSAALLILLVGPYSGSLAAPATTQWVTPLEIDFGPVGVGVMSQPMQVTITNTGLNPLTNWAGGGLSAPFNVTQDCNIVGGVLPGHSCHYFFTFTPAAAGTFSATSTSTTNAGAISIIVHGQGVGAQASYDAHALDFGSVYANGRAQEVAPTQVVTISNTGLAPLTDWAGGGVSAPFNAVQDCNIVGGVLPGHSCHYYFSFSPGGAGSYSDTSNTTSNGGPVDVTLSGSAHALLFGDYQRATPRSLDFGPVGIGQTAKLSITVTNLSLQNKIINWAGGGVSAPFNASQDCVIPGGLAIGASCHFYYTFTPTTAGVFTATSTITDTFATSNTSLTFNISLKGTGAAPSLKADSLWLDFGPVPVGSSGVTQVVTLTNTGLSPVTGWAGGGVGGPFNASQDCVIPGGLLPGQSCHFTYTYHPTAAGPFSDSSDITTNAGTLHIKLQGETASAQSSVPRYIYLPAIDK